MTQSKSVEDICKLIEEYRLMSSSQYAAMRARWFRPSRKDAGDVEQFKKWLVINRYVTEFVVKTLAGAKADQLVLNQYRLQDQLTSGPMIGAYLALDPVDRQVAIEILSAHSASDPAVLAQFQEAARRAINVRHPNVGGVLDVGTARGFHYLVNEYVEGETVEEICKRSGKLPYLKATRLITLALAGLEALHAQGVPAGDLTAESLILAPAGKETPHQRTVKILNVGVRRRLFDETAIGRSIDSTSTLPDKIELKSSSTFELERQDQVDPADDMFRLGCTFYRCVTGQAPFSEREFLHPTALAKPVRTLAPGVPEMLSQIIEEMIDPVPGRRPRKAGHLAKTLRVFLAAEDQARETKAEDQLVEPGSRAATKQEEAAADEADADEAEYEEDETPRSRDEEAGVWGKVVALWEEINPSPRDIVVFGGGALLMLAAIFLLQLITGFHISYIAGLATGAVGSYFVDKYLKRREQQRQAAV
jgi:serine/threonine protein kinase